ncbi:MAG TPA: glycosyltransferase 87 family protein [Candidatus Acidoferrales bacterium]|nr:glycosyltransferase 87 family protein [Candidatus Acidoferrales bacterium]
MPTSLRAALAAAIVVMLGSLPRIMLAAGTLPDALRPFVWSDALFVYQRGLSSHRLPYLDAPFEYPPLIGGISALLSSLANGPLVFVAAWAVLVALAAGACAALLASVDARATWRYWVLAPQLLLLGTVNFDLIPALLMTVAVVTARARRDVIASTALALGAVAKFYPGASAPILIARSSNRLLATVVFTATLLVAYLPTVFRPFSGAAGLGFYLVGIRANLDSVWGSVERVLVGAGVPNAPLLVVVVTLVGLAVSYVALVVPRALRTADPARAFCLTTVALLLWSRLYSPQYSLWVLPFFVLLGVRGRVAATLAVADVMVFFTIYPLTLVRWRDDDPLVIVLLSLLVAAVLLRHFALWRTWRAAWEDVVPVPLTR